MSRGWWLRGTQGAELPLWRAYAGARPVDSSRARAAGLNTRSLRLGGAVRSAGAIDVAAVICPDDDHRP